MSVKAKLLIDEKEINVLWFSFGFNQGADVTGRPSQRPTFIGLKLIIETRKDLNLADWSFASDQAKHLELHIYPIILGGKTRKLFFYDSHLINWNNNFSSTGNQPISETLHITSAGVEDSNSESVYSAYWRETFKEDNVEPTVLEESTPNITNIKWIHPETKENLKETTYAESIALSAQIENQESDSVTITITKEDETEFENGQKQLTFEEIINDDGTIELTALEIKEKWQDFKTVDADKLIAKVTHNNTSKKSKPLQIVPKTKVIAQFRPNVAWNGEKYGFDWVRVGDSGLTGDTITNAYKNIIGHHYFTPPTKTIRLADDGEIKAGLAIFTKEQTEFDTYKNDFHPTTIPWKLDSAGNPEEYYVPWLSILRIPTTHPDYDTSKPDPIIDLVLSIEVKVTPERLKVKYENTYFEITTFGGTTENDSAISYLVLPDSAKVLGTQKINLTLKNIHTLPNDIKIEVLAEEKQPGGAIIDKNVGEVMVIGNAKKHRKKTKILLVNVKTNITGLSPADDKFGLIGNNELLIKNMLKKFLNQALIIPKYKKEDLDLRNNTAFNTKYVSGTTFSPTVVHSELDKAFFFDDPANPTVENPTKSNYRNYFRIYFIGESCGSGDYGEAEAVGTDTCIVYCDGLTDTTAAHELYHAMGLYHSFSNSGTFTFDYGKTDCIMDYSDIITPTLPVIQFYKWQWEILWKNTKVKNE